MKKNEKLVIWYLPTRDRKRNVCLTAYNRSNNNDENRWLRGSYDKCDLT
jgi:hypothetical protein